MGRRGTEGLVWEAIMGLLFATLFAAAVYSYIIANANGEAYFSRFYANDLATSADLVNAGYGDVILRYDNVKPTITLGYKLVNGKISVGPLGRDSLGFAYYGKASRFDGDTKLDNPAFFILRKAGGFSITDSERSLRACRGIATPRTPLEKAVVYLDTTNDPVKQTFADALKGTRLPVAATKSDANLVINFQRNAGDANIITFSPTSDEGIAYDCLFQQRLTSITTTSFTNNEPEQSGTAFNVKVTMTTRSDVQLLDKQIGQSLAHALLLAYGGADASAPTGVGTTPPPSPSPSPAGTGTGPLFLVGDSITDGYAPKVKCAGKSITQISKYGRKTSDMIPELNKGLAAAKPSTVVILGGVNDIMAGRPIKETMDNLDTMYKSAAATGARVVMVTILPSSNYWVMYSGSRIDWGPSQQQKADQLNEWIRAKYASDYIDANSLFDTDDNNVLDTQYQGTVTATSADGYLHPGPAGYSYLATLVQNKVCK